MFTVKEGQYLGDLLKFEGPQLFSRERVLVVANQALSLGTVLAETADGRITALAPSASDGREIAVGVLIVDVDALLIEQDALMVCRHAIVAHHALVWPEGITSEQKNRAIAQLKALGVLIRRSI
jgi:hypothetical protein